VQGLGRFDAIFHPAVIDFQQSQIKPPYIQPDFISQTEAEGDILPAYMHYVSGMDVEIAREEIISFANDVQQHTNNDEPYSIDKFGIFSKSAAGVLHFTPDWDAFNLSFSGLAILELHPTPVLKRVEKFPETPVITPKEIKPSYHLVEENITTANPGIDQHADEPVSDIPDEMMTVPLDDISESTSRMAWIILTSAIALITVLCAYLAWDIISDRKRMYQLSQLYPDTLIITDEFDIPVIMDTSKTNNESIPSTNPVVTPDTISKPPEVKEETETPCYVVVGAFTNPDNVTRMMQRLEGLGYKSAEIKGGALTRVVISTSCDKGILEKTLNEARSSINPEAWIY